MRRLIRALLPALTLAFTLIVVVPAGPARASCTSNPELCGLPVSSTIEQPDLGVAIDIVLVGDGFIDMNDWHEVANNMINHFKNHPSNMYGTVSDLYNFHVVDVVSETTDVNDDDTADTALGMRTSGMISVSGTKLNTAALNAPDVDVAIAIANSTSGRANASFPSQLASGGRVRLSRSTSPLTHELGHALYNLADEYVESSKCSGSSSESSLLRRANATAEPTCFKFSTTPGAGCYEGGAYCAEGVYRSASSCVMRSSSAAACPACAREIEEVGMERRTLGDVAAPWLVVTAPAEGAALSGQVNVNVSAWDDWFSPSTVDIEIDGVHRGRGEAASTYVSIPLDTTLLSDGPHTLIAYATDAVGHTARSIEVSFTTSNASDVTAPLVQITQPLPGAEVSGSVGVYAQVTDGSNDTDLIVVYIDGEPVQAAQNTNYLYYPWDTSEAALGAHTIEALARDDYFNSGYAAPVEVTVVEAAPQPAQVWLQSPWNLAIVGPLFELTYWYWGAGPTATAELIVDGVSVRAIPLTTAESLIDASVWAEGDHDLMVRITDGEAVSDSNVNIVTLTAPTGPAAFITSELWGSFNGVVEVGVDGYDDVPLESIALLVDEVEVGSTTVIPGVIPWDTAGSDGVCARVVAEARAADGERARSSARLPCVDESPPELTLVSPEDGATVPQTAALFTVDYVDTSAITILELLIDGEVVYSIEGIGLRGDEGTGGNPGGKGGGVIQGTTLMAVDLTAGSHAVVVRATDALGYSAQTEPITIFAADCTPGGCEDGDPCTSDRCPNGGICVNQRIAECCVADGDCDDGDACTADGCDVDTCWHDALPACCNHGYDCGGDNQCDLGACEPVTHACGSLGLCCGSDADCDDAHPCTIDSCIANLGGHCANDWIEGCCVIAEECDDGNDCTIDSCVEGACDSVWDDESCCTDASECDDGDPCNGAETCGTDQRCQDGAPPEDGTPCDDGAPCTEGDSCQEGSCGGTPVDCSGSAGDCWIAACDPDTGQCVMEPAGEDEACDDGDPCTREDACAQGACVGGPVDCSHLDSDCVTGQCDPAQGGCVVQPVNEGEACDDGDACTVEDTCQQGQCSGQPRDCSALDSACVSGVCDAATGGCVGSAHDDGSDCDDGDACTAGEACLAGSCVGAPVDCSALDGPCRVGYCDAASGGCAPEAADEGASCDDGDPLTWDDICVAGTCAGQPLGVSWVELDVVEGWDEDKGAFLTNEDKLWLLRHSDDRRWSQKSGHWTSLAFEPIVPAGAIITAVLVNAEHFEVKGAQLEVGVGTGPLVAPSIDETAVAPFLSRKREGVFTWEVTGPVTDPNRMVVTIANPGKRRSRSQVDRVHVLVGYVLPPTPPLIVSDPPTLAVASLPYTYAALASGTEPISWALADAPPGMVVDPQAGVVSWPDPVEGVHPVVLVASNSEGAATQSFLLTVELVQSGTVVIEVAEGFDAVQRLLLSESGDLAAVQASDDDRYALSKRNQIVFEPEQRLPPDAMVLRAWVYLEHCEDKGFKKGALALMLASGTFARPAASASRKVPIRNGPENEGLFAWDVTDELSGPAAGLEGLLLVLQNRDGKRSSRVDHIYMIVRYEL